MFWLYCLSFSFCPRELQNSQSWFSVGRFELSESVEDGLAVPRRTELKTGDATSCILYRCEQGMDLLQRGLGDAVPWSTIHRDTADQCEVK